MTNLHDNNFDTNPSARSNRTSGDDTMHTNSPNDPESLKEQAKSSFDQGVDKVKSEGRQILETRKDGAVHQMNDFAEATRSAARQLDDSNHSQISPYVVAAADKISVFAENLKHKNVDEIVSDITGLARQHPGLFALGSLTIGLGLARFARSSLSGSTIEDSNHSSRSVPRHNENTTDNSQFNEASISGRTGVTGSQLDDIDSSLNRNPQAQGSQPVAGQPRQSRSYSAGSSNTPKR